MLMPPAGFEPKISADVLQQTYALDRATTGSGSNTLHTWIVYCLIWILDIFSIFAFFFTTLSLIWLLDDHISFLDGEKAN